jgi:flagellar hook assembly protein FlgD
VSNYPNPFNPRTTVSYTVPSRGHVSITIYDTNGALVRTLFNGEHNAGAFTTEWDGLADNGSAVGSGIYFARIVQNGETRTNKMTILK